MPESGAVAIRGPVYNESLVLLRCIYVATYTNPITQLDLPPPQANQDSAGIIAVSKHRGADIICN